ncbi:MAG: tRNA (adenosine(37)-N6)-threonylcarbamoyltransferase complex transferase subunit TsaD, partial [Terriglobales bacterium]
VLRRVQLAGWAPAIAERRRALAALGRAPTLPEWRQLCDQPTLDLIASFQAAVVADLLERTLAAAEERAAASIFLTGGVAANRALRREMALHAQRRGLALHAPALALCTDNAAMIAAAAFPRFQLQCWADRSFSAEPQLPLDQNVQ